MSEAGPRPAQIDSTAFKNGLFAVRQMFEALLPYTKSWDDETCFLKDCVTLSVKFVAPVKADILDPDDKGLGDTQTDSIEAESIGIYWPTGEYGDGKTPSLQFYGRGPDGDRLHLTINPDQLLHIELAGSDFEDQPKTYDLLSDLQGKRALVDLLKEAGSYDGNCFTLGDGNYLQVTFKSPVAITYFDKDDEPVGKEEQVTSFRFNEIVATDNRLEGGVITLLDLSDETRIAILEEVSLDDIESIVLVMNSQNGDDA